MNKLFEKIRLEVLRRRKVLTPGMRIVVNSDNPLLLGVPAAKQFVIPIGGVGAVTVYAAGFYLDSLSLPTEEGSVSNPNNANNIILDGESKSAFLYLRENFIRSLEPANYIELTLVERIACAQWKLRRLHTLEQQFHHEQLVELHHETLDTLEKMEKRHPMKNISPATENRLRSRNRSVA